MALWRLYYHLVWATQDRRDLITTEMAGHLYGYIIGKAVSIGGIVHAIDGTQNHTHMIASIPPKLSIANFMKSVKGSSAHQINNGPIRYGYTFHWQGGYGVFSLGQKQLDGAIAYVHHQKEHHRNGTTMALLEQFNQEDDGPAPWHPNE